MKKINKFGIVFIIFVLTILFVSGMEYVFDDQDYDDTYSIFNVLMTTIKQIGNSSNRAKIFATDIDSNGTISSNKADIENLTVSTLTVAGTEFNLTGIIISGTDGVCVYIGNLSTTYTKYCPTYIEMKVN